VWNVFYCLSFLGMFLSSSLEWNLSLLVRDAFNIVHVVVISSQNFCIHKGCCWKLFALPWWLIMSLALLEGYYLITLILPTFTNNMGKFKNLKCFPLGSPNFQVDLLAYKDHKSCENLFNLKKIKLSSFTMIIC